MSRVALVHDWLTGMRGGERVLEEIAALFPEAPIYTLVHRRGSVSEALESHPIHTSFLQRLTRGGRFWRSTLTLMPAAVESLRLPDADLVVSTSHSVAKGVLPPPGAYHLSYVHSPMRWAWDQRAVYLDSVPRALRWPLRLELARLRSWDVASSSRVDRFVANSRLVAWRIRHYWNRASTVLSPPVDTDAFTPPEAGDDGRTDRLLMVTALVPYKRVDVGIEVAERVGRPLDVIGDGPQRRRLERAAGAGTTFHGWVERERLREAYRRAAALVVPNLEDFGIAAVEALACGTPVVGLAGSGTAESVRDGREGRLAPSADPAALAEAVDEVVGRRWSRAELRRRAETFSREMFRTRFRYALDRLGFGGLAT